MFLNKCSDSEFSAHNLEWPEMNDSRFIATCMSQWLAHIAVFGMVPVCPNIALLARLYSA
jgi:hypothetical protein